MRKAGGIVAIISGILSVFAAFITILFGGVGELIGGDGAETLTYLGIAGLGISFLVIVLGAVVFFVNSRTPGVLLMLAAIAGAIFGGTLVAVFMIPVFVGGILGLFITKPRPLPESSGIPKATPADGLRNQYCSNCGNSLGVGDNFCQRCGEGKSDMPKPASQAMQPKGLCRRPLVIIAGIVGSTFLLLVVIGAIASIVEEPQSGTDSTAQTRPATTPSATSTPGPTPIIVTADSLQRQKEANNVFWDDRYLDKLVQISGTISSITEAGSYVDVKFSTDNPFVDVVCKVKSSHRAVFHSLAEGKVVKVQGRVSDDGIIDIVVKHCEILDTSDQVSTEDGEAPSNGEQNPLPKSATSIFEQYEGVAEIAATLTVYIGVRNGSGSGFLYRPPNSNEFVILTNAHVVEFNSSVEVCWPAMQTCVYEKVLGMAPDELDAAVIEFRELPQNALTDEDVRWFTDYYEMHVASSSTRSKHSWVKGDVVYASGYPGGHLAQTTGVISDPLVTEGVILADSSSGASAGSFIQHGANIASGSSGGPLLNSNSNIIGINTATSLMVERQGLATPIDRVIDWLEKEQIGQKASAPTP